MKRLSLIIRISVGVLIFLTFAGIYILIINKNLGFLDTSYEIIAFSIGAIGMIMAVLAQMDSYRQEKVNRKIIADLTALNKEALEEEQTDEYIKAKLNELTEKHRHHYKIKKPQKNTPKIILKERKDSESRPKTPNFYQNPATK